MERTRNTTAPCLAILGTGSDVGKSVVVTALCRIFSNRGRCVAPFKAQNMSNNSFVTPEGGEMGRAQVAQAEAARTQPHTDMNPVLLKPCADTGAQVVVHGKPWSEGRSVGDQPDGGILSAESRRALDRLRKTYDLIVMEGAGSCAEINLRDRDFANFRMAEAADAPVILVADIDRGGVFGQIIGTLAILQPEERLRIKGVIINRFRGDAKLFSDGTAFIEDQIQRPVLGLIPFFYHIDIDSEDGMTLEGLIDPAEGPALDKINIAVIRLPHISNFTDFAPLQREPAVQLHYLTRPRSLGGYDLVLLPGSKNVRADMAWLRERGWEAAVQNFAEAGGRIGGICGGYQLLGHTIRDPLGVEGPPGNTAGLGLLPVSTTLSNKKTLTRCQGTWKSNDCVVTGYEIHMGQTEWTAELEPVIQMTNRDGESMSVPEGALSPCGRLWGTYLHGLFDQTPFRQSFLRDLAPDRMDPATPPAGESEEGFKDAQYELLAAHFEAHLDMPAILALGGQALDRITEPSTTVGP